jgi:hypothetical protein
MSGFFRFTSDVVRAGTRVSQNAQHLCEAVEIRNTRNAFPAQPRMVSAGGDPLPWCGRVSGRPFAGFSQAARGIGAEGKAGTRWRTPDSSTQLQLQHQI